MSELQIEAAGPLTDVEADALVVPVSADRTWGPGAEWAATQLGEWLTPYLDQADFSGKPGQSVTVPGGDELPFTTVTFLGLGDDPSPEAIRKAAGAVGRAAARNQSIATTVHLVSDGAAEAFAMGLVLGQYRFDKYRSEPKPVKTERLLLADGTDEHVAAAARGRTIATGVRIARDLINEPAGGKPATEIARIATELGTAAGVRVEVRDEDYLREGSFGGVLGVAAGATNPPRLVELWYEPEGAEAFLAVVGKGIVFDSGGLSIKPAKSMETMKTDMSGAAAVIGAVKAIAELGLPVKVLGITPLAENMPGGGALRPGDVLHIRNGKTIEVLNTDAEGRLVLADGLSLAAEHEPDFILDLATLTGACHVALGDDYAGLFANGDEAAARVQAAADDAGELVWRMPLPDDYRKMLDSDVADMKNIGNRYGGAITAALLLKEFVGDYPWAHLDIAGPARASKDDGYVTTGGTGFGVRIIVALAEHMAGG